MRVQWKQREFSSRKKDENYFPKKEAPPQKRGGGGVGAENKIVNAELLLNHSREHHVPLALFHLFIFLAFFYLNPVLFKSYKMYKLRMEHLTYIIYDAPDLVDAYPLQCPVPQRPLMLSTT